MAERVLMKGNEALAEAALQAGCRHFFGYPITPQTELAAYMAKRMPKVDGVFLQAESELAAINMVLGAASTGKRVMTSSSSPGISLKTEGISYICGSDLPALIVNVQRGGPGLGGIQPSQADYWQATKAPGHGDAQVLVFAPSTVQEMVDVVFDAFDLADKYRMPAMILADGMLGQMMEPVVFKERDMSTLPEKPWATTGHEGKRKHNIVNSLYLKPEELEKTINERFERYRVVSENEVRYESYMMEDAEIVVVSYGSVSRSSLRAIRELREQGVKVGHFRPITLWPFPDKEIAAFSKRVKHIIVPELNAGQMVLEVERAVKANCEVHSKSLINGELYKPAEIMSFIKEVA